MGVRAGRRPHEGSRNALLPGEASADARDNLARDCFIRSRSVSRNRAGAAEEWRPPARRFQNLARSDREDDLTEMCVGAHVREGGVGFGERIGLVDGQAEFAGFCRWQ